MATTVLSNLTGHPHDYRQTVAPWFRSIFYLHPDSGLIKAAPIGFQLHAQLAWLLFAVWPFTRLVHVFSAPVGYLTRPYVPYRSRGDSRLGLRNTRRGGTGSAPETADHAYRQRQGGDRARPCRAASSRRRTGPSTARRRGESLVVPDSGTGRARSAPTVMLRLCRLRVADGPGEPPSRAATRSASPGL
jgi:hypothetical protein